MKNKEKRIKQPAQTQNKQPGIESKMKPAPEFVGKFSGNERLKNKIAVITGGDSGIGRAVAIAFAKEGADVVVSYLDEHNDAKKTKREIEKLGRKCQLISGDISKEKHCQKIIKLAIEKYGSINILVNNAGVQYPQKSITNITAKQLEKTFRTNVFSQFYLVQYALKYLKKGANIINTTSVTAYRGNPDLIDYSSSKGAIVAFTRALAASLIKEGIRVNGVAPGPIWTPLIPATFSSEKVAEFGSDTPIGRVGQPNEVASCYVFLASDEASYISGQMLHPNGGESINT